MDGTSKRMHLSNRNHLFLPLNQGGLGLRPMDLVNKSLLAKQVWRVISADQSSLLAVTLGRKYIDWSKEHWLRKPYNSSWLWNDILECSSFITITFNGKLVVVHLFLSTTLCGGPCKALLEIHLALSWFLTCLRTPFPP